MKKKIGFAILIIFVIIMSSVYADSPTLKYSYEKEVNGNSIFIMLGEHIENSNNESIANRYSESGLYNYDDISNPVWTIDFYAEENSIYISDDRQYLVRRGPMPEIGSLEQLAVSFYKNGELLKSYNISSFVRQEKRLPTTTSHFGWVKKYSIKNNKLYIITTNWKFFTIDITTGEMKGVIDTYPVPTSYFSIILILLATIVLLYILVRLFGNAIRKKEKQ